MDRRKRTRTFGLGIAAVGLALMMPGPAHAQGQVAAFGESMIEQFQEWTGWEDDGTSPMSVHKVACLIDCLDKKLYKYGKIAVKSPDVFGQNRMTGYRADYEDQMKSQLGAFELILSSYLRRSDSAALTSATSVAAGLQAPQVANSRNVSTTNVTPPALALPLSSLFTNASQLVGTASPDLTPTTVAASALTLANTGSKQGIGLEPTVALDERSNYLYHLNQLRRINAGDDSADVAGYGLYLIRMPVSLLPSGDSVMGKGASVTVKARHNLSPDVLSNTFRTVVIFETAYSMADTLDRGLLLGKASLLPPNNAGAGQGPSRGGAVATGTAGDTPNSASSGQRKGYAAAASVPSGNRGGAAGNGPSTEVLLLYGGDNMGILVDALSDDEKTWYRHDPSLISWLGNELNAAYGYMRDQAHRNNPMFQPIVFEQVGQLVLQRRYDKLNDYRKAWLANLRAARGSTDTQPLPIDILSFALIVQSVYLDRQIKYDMEFLAQRKGCACGDPWALTFYDLYPSTPEDTERYENAKAAFAAYVECKWPIHIFAIDPVVDQQNQLDLFSQRTQLQLALAIALSSGQVNFQNATSYARRTELDLESIALNRTAVGFGAGDSTFGWQFYPRIQSPPLQSNLQRIAGILINNGPGPDYALAHSKIEPGLRECYALVVMPNFVPSIRFTSVANWFDLKTKCAEQVIETTDMVRLSKKFQAARNSLAQACDPGRYRPDEVEMLTDRLSQLEDMLPLKSHKVDLPFESSLLGSEIFSSTPTGLAPRLLGWYGEAPQEGTPSSIFLLGTGFTVYETYVIAGGVPVTSTDASGAKTLELFSRNVMRIQIPATARAIETSVPLTDPDGTWRRRKVIDIHVATPNGISNHLLVDVQPKAASAQPPAAAVRTVKLNYTLLRKDDSLPSGNVLVFLGVSPAKAEIDLSWPAGAGTAPTTAVAQLTFPNALVPGGADIVVTASLVGNGTTFPLTGVPLSTLSATLVSQVDNLLTPSSPDVPLTTSQISLTPPGGKAQDITATSGPLVFTLEGTQPAPQLSPAKFAVNIGTANTGATVLSAAPATPDLTLDWLGTAPQVEIVSLTIDFTLNGAPTNTTLVFTDADFTLKGGVRTIKAASVASKLNTLLLNAAATKPAPSNVFQARSISIKAQVGGTLLAPVPVNLPFEIDFGPTLPKRSSLGLPAASPIAGRSIPPGVPGVFNDSTAMPGGRGSRAAFDPSLERTSAMGARAGARGAAPRIGPGEGLPPLPSAEPSRRTPAPAAPGRAAPKAPDRPRRPNVFQRLSRAFQQ